ncbi:MAG TPA: hypothetical protein VFQ86_01365, partial [Arachidicoccus soli]|nr:hypothetical protein [Arachidicoccus soli]
MKIRKISLALLSISFLLGGSVFAQKSNVVSAAVAYQSYMRSIMGQNLDKAKSDLEDAKKYIDPTMTNEDTKDDPKANYYNAVINYSMIELASSGKFDDLKKYVSDSTLDVVAASAKKTENSSRWNGELKDFFKRKVYQATTVGKMMFDKKKYKMAFAGFLGAYKLKKMVGLDKGL